MAEIISGTNGDDTLTNSLDNATIVGGSGNDKITNELGYNVSIDGGAGNDTIKNTSGDNATLLGGADNDSIYNDNSYNAILSGGKGDDTVRNVGSTNVSMSGDEGNDYLYNNSRDVTLDGGKGDDYIDNFWVKASIDGGADNDTIRNENGANSTIYGGSGNDSIYNTDNSSLVAIYGGDGNDTIRNKKYYSYNRNDNVTIEGGAGNDFIANENASLLSIYGEAGDDTIYNYNGNNSTLLGGAGNDSIKNENASNVSIEGGEGKDTIDNYSSAVTIKGDADADEIYNYAGNVVIYGGTGADYIYNNNNSWVSGGDGNDTIINDTNGNNAILYGGAGNDIISLKSYYSYYHPTVSGDTGDDIVYADDKAIVYKLAQGDGNNLVYSQADNNSVSIAGDYYYTTLKTGSTYTVSIYGGGAVSFRGSGNPKIVGGTYSTVSPDKNINENSDSIVINGDYGNDTIISSGNNTTLVGNKGDDQITNSGKNVVFRYTEGDGNDLITGFNATSTLQIGNGTGTYSTLSSGKDIIVTVGDAKITLKGAASLSNVNIDGQGVFKEEWSLKGTTATYGTSEKTLVTVKGVKSLDGLSVSGKTVTVANSALNKKKVTVNNGYTLALADDVNAASISKTWSYSNSKATLKQTKSVGYALSDDAKSITYSKKSTSTLATVSGVKSKSGLSVDGKIITVSKAALNAKKVTVNNGYTFALGDNVAEPTAKKASWTFNKSKSTATYNQTTTAGYTLASNKKSITYSKASTKNLFTISGVKTDKGLSLKKKVVTVSKASLGTKNITISDDSYTLKLGSDVSKSTTKNAWSYSNSTATYKQTKSAGYTLDDNAITYSKKSTSTLATVKGAKSKSGLSVKGNVIKLKNSALKSKVTISGGYEFDFQSDYKNATITGSKDSDTITARGKNISINGGSGNDLIKIFGSGTISGGDGADIFYLNSKSANIISDYSKNDVISLASGAANISKSGNDIIFNGKITVQGGATKNITYIENGVEKINKSSADEIKFNSKGTAVTLTADYSAESFTPSDYSDYATKLVTIDAAEVTNPLTITGNKKGNFIVGSGEDDVIYGELGADIINGIGGNDSIFGGAGNDSLNGGAGDDSLWGGVGSDTLIGGKGADTFIYNDGDGNDVIFDYESNIDRVMVMSGLVGSPDKDNSGNVTFKIGSSGQIVFNDSADRYIEIVNSSGNVQARYTPTK